MKKTYGVVLKVRSRPSQSVEMNLTGREGSRVVMAAAQRVIATPEMVLKAWAKR